MTLTLSLSKLKKAKSIKSQIQKIEDKIQRFLEGNSVPPEELAQRAVTGQE